MRGPLHAFYQSEYARHFMTTGTRPEEQGVETELQRKFRERRERQERESSAPVPGGVSAPNHPSPASDDNEAGMDFREPAESHPPSAVRVESRDSNSVSHQRLHKAAAAGGEDGVRILPHDRQGSRARSDASREEAERFAHEKILRLEERKMKIYDDLHRVMRKVEAQGNLLIQQLENREMTLLEENEILMNFIRNNLSQQGRAQHSQSLDVRGPRGPKIRQYILPEGRSVPGDFICPITQEIIREPVVVDDGHYYEENAICMWVEKKQSSPLTNMSIRPVGIRVLFIKNMIKKWVEDNGGEVEEESNDDDDDV